MSGLGTKRWIPDNASEHCGNCHEQFSFINRKHHCRACGRLLCAPCCSNWLLIPKAYMMSAPNTLDDHTIPQRCCTTCSHQYAGIQTELRQTNSKANATLRFDKDSADRHRNVPVSRKLETDIRKAAHTLYNFTFDDPVQGTDGIPRELIKLAKGIVFITILKAGFLFSGRVGTGLVIAKLEDGTWSAPSAVIMSGMGWGFQAGGELTDVILILTTRSAVNAFCSKAQVSIGTELAVSLGPIGRSAGGDISAGSKGAAAAFSYAHSKGLFFGISLEASVIACRPDINRQFYGAEITPTLLLNGVQPRPKAAEPLYKALDDLMSSVEGRERTPLSTFGSRYPVGDDDNEDGFITSDSTRNRSFNSAARGLGIGNNNDNRDYEGGDDYALNSAPVIRFDNDGGVNTNSNGSEVGTSRGKIVRDVRYTDNHAAFRDERPPAPPAPNNHQTRHSSKHDGMAGGGGSNSWTEGTEAWATSPNTNNSNKSMTSSGSSTNLGAYTAFSDILSPPSPTSGTGGNDDDDGEGAGSPNVTKIDRRMQLLHELTAAGDQQQHSQPQPQQQKPSQQQQKQQSQRQSHTHKVGSPGFEVEDQLDELLLNDNNEPALSTDHIYNYNTAVKSERGVDQLFEDDNDKEDEEDDDGDDEITIDYGVYSSAADDKIMRNSVHGASGGTAASSGVGGGQLTTHHFHHNLGDSMFSENSEKYEEVRF